MVKDPTGEKQGFEQMLPASTAAELRERVFGRQVTEPETGYAVAEAEAMGAAEAAHAYINDAFVLKEQGAALSLVSNAGRAGGDEHARAMYDVNDKLGKIYAAPGPARLKLGELESKLLAALRTRKLPDDLSMSEIDAAIAEAVAEANGHGADSLEEKKERLTGEIKAIDEDMDKRYKRMVQMGLITQKDYDDWHTKKEFADANPNDEKAQQALQTTSQSLITKAEGNAKTPADHQLIAETQDLATTRAEKQNERLAYIEGLASKRPMTIAQAQPTDNPSLASSAFAGPIGIITNLAVAAQPLSSVDDAVIVPKQQPTNEAAHTSTANVQSPKPITFAYADVPAAANSPQTGLPKQPLPSKAATPEVF